MMMIRIVGTTGAGGAGGAGGGPGGKSPWEDMMERCHEKRVKENKRFVMIKIKLKCSFLKDCTDL